MRVEKEDDVLVFVPNNATRESYEQALFTESKKMQSIRLEKNVYSFENSPERQMVEEELSYE